MNTTPKTSILIFSVSALLYLLVGINYGVNIYAEGLALFGADMVSKGYIPYLDFWTIYTPGQFYLLAGFMNIFGWDILAGRLLTVLLIISSGVILTLLGKKLSYQRMYYLPFILTVIWFGLVPSWSRSVPSALFLSLLSIFTYLKFNDKNAGLILPGALAAMTGFFRHDFGLYVLIAIIAGNFVFNNQWKTIIKKSFWVVIGFMIVLIPIAAYFLSNVPFDILKDQLVDTPREVFADYRSLPFPVFEIFSNPPDSLRELIIKCWQAVVFLIPIIFIIYGFIYYFKNRNSEKGAGIFIFALLSLLMYSQCIIRSDTEHLTPSIVIAFPLIVFALIREGIKKSRKILIFISIAFIVSFPLMKKTILVQKIIRGNSVEIVTDRSNYIKAEPVFANDYNDIIDYIRKHSSENDIIFSGCIRHDKLLINDVMIYFLTAKNSASFYHELHPGVTTTLEVQDRIIDEISKNNPALIILSRQDAVQEPNKSSESSGVTLLDEYISDRYRHVFEKGAYSILEKRTSLNED